MILSEVRVVILAKVFKLYQRVGEVLRDVHTHKIVYKSGEAVYNIILIKVTQDSDSHQYQSKNFT